MNISILHFLCRVMAVFALFKICVKKIQESTAGLKLSHTYVCKCKCICKFSFFFHNIILAPVVLSKREKQTQRKEKKFNMRNYLQ